MGIYTLNLRRQYSDTGVLVYGDKKVNVIKGELIGNASESETDIRYLVDSGIPVGSEVRCELNWDQRFSKMQNHSGEHIVSGLIHNLYGYNNIGFHLSDDEPVTLTVDGKLTAEQIRTLEIKANEAIYEDLPITDSYPAGSELSSIDYRSKIDIAGQVRLITIGDPAAPLDICACCAPHVLRTGSIGIIKIISSASVKGGTQLSILCGKRALEFTGKNIDNLESMAKSFSTHRDNVPELVANLRSENRILKNRLSEAVERSILSEIKDYDSCMEEVERFLPFVDNWATCDQMSPKVFKKNKEELLEKIRVWIRSGETYTVRFATGMLMEHFLDEDFDAAYPDMVSEIRSEEYYVNMMTAWYFATALAKQYEAVLPYIEDGRLDPWTHNKAIQKAVESYRITPEQKEYLKSLKIKKK